MGLPRSELSFMSIEAWWRIEGVCGIWASVLVAGSGRLSSEWSGRLAERQPGGLWVRRW